MGSPLAATAVVVDLRGFTAELNRTCDQDGSREAYCRFLAEMNASVVNVAGAALPVGLRGSTREHVHIGATGDGALIVFTAPDHVRQATLAALLLRRNLERACRAYTETSGQPMDFGIGVESGTVRAVGAYGPQELATYIGGCINVAARVQDLTKTIDRTHVVFGARVVDALLRELFPERHAFLGEEIRSGSVNDAEYLENERRRIALNRQLCITFLHVHRLRGFDRGLQLFRLSRSSGVLGNPRFDGLLERLVAGDPSWLGEVRGLLA